MNYVKLSSWGKRIVVGEDFTIEVKCNKSSEMADPQGYGINFQKKLKEEDAGIIFHFKPVAPESAVYFRTLQVNEANKKTSWDSKTMTIQDDNVKEIYFANSFKLKLKPVTESSILVYVNDKFKTEYECPNKKITDTEYIFFSPSVSIEQC